MVDIKELQRCRPDDSCTCGYRHRYIIQVNTHGLLTERSRAARRAYAADCVVAVTRLAIGRDGEIWNRARNIIDTSYLMQLHLLASEHRYADWNVLHVLRALLRGYDDCFKCIRRLSRLLECPSRFTA